MSTSVVSINAPSSVLDMKINYREHNWYEKKMEKNWGSEIVDTGFFVRMKCNDKIEMIFGVW